MARVHRRDATTRRTAVRAGAPWAAWTAGVLLTLWSLVPAPAQALTQEQRVAPPEDVVANATWFYALGGPYGGCGMAQAELETQYFVALNVYDLPNDYGTFHRRPIESTYDKDMGMWNNGLNCGRWVQVTIGDFCRGDNDGAMNKPFCRDGEGWVEDEYNGATLNMIVADSCGDGNAWCRDDPYHLDLAQGGLNMFAKDGVPVGDMDPGHWNNRHISWKFIPAPDYTGDIRIGFMQSAQTWWPSVAISRLENGIHSVDYFQDGAWKPAQMNGDMGQAYILGATVSGGSSYQIRVRDADDELINDGRVYSFAFPESCQGSCNGPFTPVTYTTSTEPGPATEVGTTSTPPSGTDPAQSTAPEVPRTCTATYRTTQSWPGGFKGQITVTAGSNKISRWSVTWQPGADHEVQDLWNANVSTSSSGMTVTPLAYNSALAAGESVTLEFSVLGTDTEIVPSCTAG